MRRRVLLLAALAAGTICVIVPSAAAESSDLRVVRLEVEHARSPLGIGTARPRLGWILDARERGQRQTAYQVQVGTAPERGDVWDSGHVRSDASIDVRYGGPDLRGRTRYWWRVRAWDAAGRASHWSAPAWFETALLDAGDWKGDWIAGPGAGETPPSLRGSSWVWFPEGDPRQSAPAATRYFRRTFDLAGQPSSARLIMTADDGFVAWVNGREVARTDPDPEQENWRRPVVVDVASALHEGTNVVAVAATNGRESPAGLLGRLDVGGETIDTDAAWRTAIEAPAGWLEPGFDDAGWEAAKVLATWGESPWGEVNPAAPTHPEPLLRRRFALAGKPVRRARLYAAGVAYAELTVNGRRVTDAVLEPGFTRYDTTVQYVSHDVTDLLRAGSENVLGARLGRGFFGMTQPNVWNWHATPWQGEPRLRAQLEVTYADGTTDLVTSDETWRVHDGPVRFDSLYGGETYDAREEQPAWDRPGFDDGAWQPATTVAGPAGRLVAEQHEPIRVTQTLKPERVTNPKPGTYVFHLPRNIAGWARLRVHGPAGTKLSLKHGERLAADGTVIAESEHVTGRFEVDEYVLAGRDDVETWEPRYVYHGFQYVEVTGWPGEPTVNDLDGRVVHSDVETVGHWESSNELLNTVRTLTRHTVLNNLHGIPTDTPKYEKNGWTGDAQLMAETDIFEFDLRRLFEKWMADLRDSQGENGLFPGIAPDNGWGLGWPGQAPPWNAAAVLIPWWMYERYGDRQVLADHWPALRRYIEYELGRAPDGLHSSTLNDYLAPGYGGNSPEDPTLAGTAYAYENVRAAARIADVLGNAADAERYTAAAARIRDAFNAAFLRGDAYVTQSDPDYRQTSSLLALAFGLVPAEREEAVFDRLVADIEARGEHLNTGALGTKFLLPELTRRGYGELAYRVATQRTYPSWGYWIDNGATSLWERWDTEARSRDHAFLGGAIDEWLFEDLAGIEPLEPGWRRFEVAPQPLGDLRWVRASTETVRGRIAVRWERERERFVLSVEVPVGATAVVRLPGGGVREVGSGSYRFSTNAR